jgi:iron complex transport system permease protein
MKSPVRWVGVLIRGQRILPSNYPWSRLAIALLSVMVIAFLAGGIGSVYIPFWIMVKIVVAKFPGVEFAHTWPESWDTIVWRLRFPRIVLAGVVGAALAISGGTYQGLFRNPLADPYLIGVAGGASLGATIVLLTRVPLYFQGFSVLTLVAFIGGLSAVLSAYYVARKTEGLHLTTLILAGVAISSMTVAITSFLIIRSDPDVRSLLGWILGGFIGVNWDDVIKILPYVVIGSIVMIVYGRIMNVLQLNEDEAKQIGVNVERTKMILIVAASLTTAAAVSVSGLIGFVGLIAPHVVRLIWGYDNRFLLPMAMLVGAGFLILADVVARTAVSPNELPVGVVTAFCGAPFFLYILRRVRGLT